MRVFFCSRWVSHTGNNQFLAVWDTYKKLCFPQSSDGKVLVGKTADQHGLRLPGEKACEAWEHLLDFPSCVSFQITSSQPSSSSETCGKTSWGTPCGKCGEENGESLTLLSCVFSRSPSLFVFDIVVLIYSFFPSLPSLMDFKQSTFPLKRFFSNLLIWSPLLSSSGFTS